MSEMQKDLYIIFGPPGSGKTVQAGYLSKQLKLDYLSWGYICRDKMFRKKYPSLEIIRDEKTSIEERSKKIADIIESEIDELVAKGSTRALVLDGFPRRIEEAEHLLKILEKYNYRIKALININPSLDTAFSRCQSRTICATCGKYYDDLVPPKEEGVCDKDGDELVRFEITKEQLRAEFLSYLRESVPAIQHLKQFTKIKFDVSGDDDEIITFSNILLKVKNEINDGYSLFKKQTQSTLETKYGQFKMITYQSRIDYSYHLALVKGDVSNGEEVLTRVHSSCITGDIFGSCKCDCGEQLAESMRAINEKGRGIIIYLFQEGRGINIINKIEAYKLQSEGMDTVEANEALGFPAEMRDYLSVKNILDDLGVKSIVLLTNNPDKVNKLTELGIIIHGTQSLEIKPNTHNEKYLLTKKEKMSHKLTKYYNQ